MIDLAPVSTATLSSGLQGLKSLDVADLSRYKAALEAGQSLGWGYYFPYLLARNKPGRRAVLLAEDERSVCVFEWSVAGGAPRLDLLFPPIPMDPAALIRGLERANDFNRDGSARVKRIDEKDAGVVAAVTTLRVNPRRAQYLFAPSAYQSLAGGKNHTIRRNVALVERRPDIEVTPFRPDHADECRALLARWQTAHRDQHGGAGGAGISGRAIALAGTLPDRDLRGEVIQIDGHVAGFAFGGEIRPGLACSFERKCDTAIRGLSYFQLRRLLLSLNAYGLVNDGSDTGREGLRQLKESFRPVAMHLEFRASPFKVKRLQPA